MRQIVRRVIDRKGRVRIVELPAPHLEADNILVQNAYSLISSGTEISTISKTPMELVKQTLADPWMRNAVKQTVLSAGLSKTGNLIWQEMVISREIGYSGAGKVLAVGENVTGVSVGETVAYAATGHAEVAAPSFNHVSSVPEGVALRHAAFVTVAGIAMHAWRRAEVQLGEVVAVFGLGLVGQLCAMIAKAAGCVVIGIDINDQRNALAESCGADLSLNPSSTDLKRRIMDFTGKQGVDATLVCASSKSSDIVNSSIEVTRKQGRVVLVGYVGLDVHPKNFLYREVDLRYSRAYGPGSYHNAYEKGRVDYPFGYVRWTEKRNLQEVIRLIANGAIDVERLIGGEYTVDEAQTAFSALSNGTFSGVAALIDYQSDTAADLRTAIPVRPRKKKEGAVGISVVGVGNHTLAYHLPNLKAHPEVEIRSLVSATGKNAEVMAKRYDVVDISSDIESALSDEGTDAVMISSGHSKHFEHACAAIKAGKAVFLEKPMVATREDFEALAELLEAEPVLFTLGLNRRYSSLVTELLETVQGPVDAVNYEVALPFVAPEHWTLDEVDGGGRLVAEAEHFIDLCHLLVGRKPLSVYARALGKVPENIRNMCSWAGAIHYDNAVANIIVNESGVPGYPREKITVFAGGQVAILDNFATLKVFGKNRKTSGKGSKADMGHERQLQEFVAAVKGEQNNLLKWEDAAMATRCMLAAEESISAKMKSCSYTKDDS